VQIALQTLNEDLGREAQCDGHSKQEDKQSYRLERRLISHRLRDLGAELLGFELDVFYSPKRLSLFFLLQFGEFPVKKWNIF